ncbi:MAG TPA: sigma-54 dependent transcriptional regulator [bacterium]
MAFKVLIVDDEDLIRWSLQEALKNDGYGVLTAKTGEDAITIFNEESPDVILMDIKLPGINGIEALKKIKDIDGSVQVIMITAFAEVNTAVDAMKAGAADYIIKPFNIEEVKIIVGKCTETLKVNREFSRYREEEQKKVIIQKIVGNSPQIKRVLEFVEKIAASEANCILVTGESGTGKELIARKLHFDSLRKGKPFMEIDCTALPETLIESELFGHEKGAFTDAKTLKHGLLEISDGGTVFLDEVSEMSLSSQSKFLRFIETQTFKRVGGTKDIKVDVKIIAATNRNLEEYIKSKKFREDLYFRLNVIPICMPPLRERREDIPLLMAFFIEQFNKKFKKNIRAADEDAMEFIMNYNWPGNIRELKNIIERAVLLESAEFIKKENLVISSTIEKPVTASIDQPITTDNLNLEETEKDMIVRAINKANGNKTLAAKLLGISRDTLRYRMEKYGIE